MLKSKSEVKIVDFSEDLLQTFFNEKCYAKSTEGHITASVKLYEQITGLSLTELIQEADFEEETGIRWKNRKIKSYLMTYRQYLFLNKSEGTAKQYFADIKTIYLHFEIELQKLPTFKTKSIDKTYEIAFEDILTKNQLKQAYYEANNVCKCIILLGTSSGLSKVDMLNLTVSDFLKSCSEYIEYDDTSVISQLKQLRNNTKIIPFFKGNRQKTNVRYTTFASPEFATHTIEYLIGRDAKIKAKFEKDNKRGIENTHDELKSTDKLFKISESHLYLVLSKINDKLAYGTVGKFRQFRTHMFRKYHSTTLLNLESPSWNIHEIDALQGRTLDETHRAYFVNSKDKLLKKYVESVDNLMLFQSLHEVDKEKYDQVVAENNEYKIKLDEQEVKINKIMEIQKELESMVGLK